MAGIGIGLGVGLGGSGGLSEAGIARAIAGKGLTDAAARAAIGGAASLAAGLRIVGLLPGVAPAPTPTPTPIPTPSPTPAATPLPAGIAAMWDAASLAALADGAAVTNWTDSVGGAVAAQTGDSGVSHSFVANSGGLPAVRLSGAAVLATSGSNAANTAMAGSERTMIVVARTIQTAGAGQANPCLVSSGTGTGILLMATPTQTGRFGLMTDCGDAGMRTIAYSGSGSLGLGVVGVNGTAIAVGNDAGGQVAIGGWQSAGTACCGRADVLAVLVWNRALTAAELKQVHRRYCDLTGQARPGGATARTVSFVGDSLTAGYNPGLDAVQQLGNSYPRALATGLGLAWGTWDQLGVPGYSWTTIQNATLPMLGNVSAATGNRSIVCAFEFANMRGSTGASVAAAARTVIDALHAQDGNREIVFATSTDDGSASGVATRQHCSDYNAYWDDAGNRAGIAAYVPLHLDANIGVQGAAPTDGTANTYYQADDLHLAAAGYAAIDNGPRGFRTAVQARLAA